MYMPQIDTMRFFAVISIVCFHWFERFQMNIDMSFGSYRVPLLLSLSGFLITSILLSMKDGSHKIQTIKRFFWKRALRIIPPYYLFLIIMVKLNDGFVISYIPFFLTFTSNWLEFSGIQVYTINTGHLWNLAVLEQFYLTFPFLLLFIKVRFEILLSLVIIIIGVALRTYMAIEQNHSFYYFTITSFDYLGGGVLLGIITCRYNNWLKTFLSKKGSFLIILFFFLAFIFHYYTNGWLSAVGYNIATLIFCFCLIHKLSFGIKGIVGRILGFNLFLSLGRISYGIYIYHMGSPYFLSRIFDKTGIAVEDPLLLLFINLVFLLVISYASWYIIEKPILKIGNRIDFFKQAVSKGYAK